MITDDQLYSQSVKLTLWHTRSQYSSVHVFVQVRPAGMTVCEYRYDTGTLVARARQARDALPRAEIYYAIKANSHPALLAAVAPHVHGLEVASGGELAKAVTAGARSIIFGGPAKTDAALASAVDAGAMVNVESVHELRRLAALRCEVDVCLRVNRLSTVPSGSHRMTGTATPFGIDEAALPEAAAIAHGLPTIRLRGFHLHGVSNNPDAAAHNAFVADALDWSASTSAALGMPCAVVNVGGGFGVSYTSDDAFDVSRMTVLPPPGVRLIFELGRWLAADAGRYVAEVLDLKRTHGRWFAVLRGGTHHFRLPAAWGYDHPFGIEPVEHWPYPWPRPEIRDTEVDAVGELCTTRDVLCRGQRVDRLRVGDLLVFARTGAYGYDISHHDFLSHEPPDFVIT
jgi:diaminopimelate decarboxylase